MAECAVYLDYNATAPVRPAAVEAVARALTITGNPSSIHRFGRAARQIIETARETVAALVGAAPAGVIFTSGGTEANALALAGFDRRVLASAVEHPSIFAGPVEQQVPVDRHGRIDLVALEGQLAASRRPSLLALMLANNETGVLQPVAEAAEIARRHGALVHCDAVQAAGRVPVNLGALGVHSLAISAHKLGGPPGVGALILADAEAEIVPMFGGGGQERRRRSGTENVAGIAGFAAAVSATLAEDGLGLRLAAMRDRLEVEAQRIAPMLRVFGAAVERLPNTSCLAVPSLTAQTVLMALDLAGIAVSAGSACSSGKLAPSPVLTAMGERALAGSAVRISLGWASQESDIDHFLAAFRALLARVQPSGCAA